MPGPYPDLGQGKSPLAGPRRRPRSEARPELARGEGNGVLQRWGQGGPHSAGEGLLRVEGREHFEVAEHAGQLVRRPRLAAVAAVLGVADQAEAAARLVLGDGQVARERVPVAGAARGAQAQAPAGDAPGVAVLPDLADLEDGRFTARAHGTLPSGGSGVRSPPCGAPGP